MEARLVLTFSGSSGDVVFSYPRIDPEVESTDVQACMEAIVTNGSIFSNVPLAIKSAKLVITQETNMNVSNS